MNCKECQSILDDYFDRELEHELSQAVSSHLEECEVCAAELNGLRAEHDVFQVYGAEPEVPDRLWANIEARLGSELGDVGHVTPRSWAARVFAVPRLSVPVTAALVLSAVVVTVLVMRINTPEKHLVTTNVTSAPVTGNVGVSPAPAVPLSTTGGRDARAPSASRIATHRRAAAENSKSKTAEQLVRDAERKYLAAINILARDIGRKQSQIDPETRAKLDRALASIDRTIAATRKVVRERPDDPVAAQYLLSAYARKVDALREMATGVF
jgi:Putative zinc-finger